MRGTLAVKNSQDTDLKIVLEPWADEFLLSPGKTIEVTFSGPVDGRLEVESQTGAIIVWGWEGSVLSAQIKQ